MFLPKLKSRVILVGSSEQERFAVGTAVQIQIAPYSLVIFANNIEYGT